MRLTASRWLVAGFLACAPVVHAATTHLQLLSATVKDQKIAGAEVTLQKNGAQSAMATSDVNGKVTLNASFPAGNDALLIIKKAGYSTLVAKCPCDGMTYALSPVIESKLDGLRVVLNWGASPHDLDSHLVYGDNHIFFEQKTGQDANLDVDDTDSYGPETITVEKKRFGEKYVYAVHQYSADGALKNSAAKVFVYIGESLVKSYYLPANASGKVWMVFAIDGNGEIQDINQFSNGDINASLAAQLKGEALSQVVAASSAERSEAKRLNSAGEAAYHAKDLAKAVELFRQAVDSDPSFGQAYSNLGLAYQKSNRIAEAIWANRKAIALADGSKANVTRASSYFNIARIYENAGQFADALQQFELAQAQRPFKTYEEAIARMKAKLPK